MASTAWVFAILHKVCVVHQMHTAAAANLTQREHSRCQPRFLDPQRSDYCCPVLSASMDGRCCLSNSASAISVESSPFAELHETQRPVQELLSLRVDLEQLGKGPRRLIPRASDQGNTTSYREFLPGVVVISAEAARQRKVPVSFRKSCHRVSAWARTP